MRNPCEHGCNTVENAWEKKRPCLWLGALVLWSVLEILQLCSQKRGNRARQATAGEENVIQAPSGWLLPSLLVEEVGNGGEEGTKQTKLGAGGHCLLRTART